MSKYRVCHYPQIPCKPFIQEADSVREGWVIMNAIANYDLFLLANNHRIDYSNGQDFQVFDEEEGEWGTYRDEYDDEVREIALEKGWA